MQACVATLAALSGEMADICIYVILIFISDKDLVTDPAVCLNKIVNQQFATCSGSPPQCSTFSSTVYVHVSLCLFVAACI